MATYYVDTAGSNTSPYDTWAKAINDAATLESVLEGTAAAADIFYIMGGTTFTEDGSAWDMSGVDGTATAPITIIGVNAGTTNAPPTYADWADGNMAGGADGRPTINMGAYSFSAGDYYKFFNISFKTTQASGIAGGLYNIFYNCKFEQSSGTNDRAGCSPGTYSACISCEACGLVGTAVVCRAFKMTTDGLCIFCYAHDARTGYYLDGTAPRVLFSIAEDCSEYGAYLVSAKNVCTVINCSLNDISAGTGYGIGATTGAGCVVMNNIIKSCNIGVDSSTQTDANFFWNNHLHDNTDNWDGVAETAPHGDLAATSGDPKYTADGNLSLQSDSPCIDAALALTLGVG